MSEPNSDRQHMTDHTEGLPAAVAIPTPCARESSILKTNYEHYRRQARLQHDPATCWWCLNPQSETEVRHMREHANEDSLTEHGSPMEVSR